MTLGVKIATVKVSAFPCRKLRILSLCAWRARPGLKLGRALYGEIFMHASEIRPALCAHHFCEIFSRAPLKPEKADPHL